MPERLLLVLSALAIPLVLRLIVHVTLLPSSLLPFSAALEIVFPLPPEP